jgi:acyl-CoA synthetase (AMP-forming)/AMP-acid ligase II
MSIVEGGPGVVRRVSFTADLECHGDATAVIDVDGASCSYAELAARADEVAHRIGRGRRLVLVEAANDLDGIVAYLGALRGGHVVLLVAPGDERNKALLGTYDPDVLIGPSLAVLERHRAPRHELHPDLALLLSTSGSTGSPKLVRLSHENLEANAAAIAEYLGLRAEDRAITSLPLQYCYGLSVLHSHLTVGAGVVCTAASVVDPCFWHAVDRHGVTNVAGVPHTYELLDRTDFAERTHPSLRLMTQAGGRLAPEDVRRWRGIGEQRGFDLFVMYGQTEATARMAYLPPSLAEHRPAAVGVAIPGGTFRLEPVEDAGPDEGELVYSGPNVMLGYAETPADLALGRAVTELRTGDLARIDDGVVEIVTRLNRFVKVFGLRIDLGRVDGLLREAGIQAESLGDDGGVAVAVLDGTDPDAVRTLVAERIGLPPSAVAAATVAELPRLGNGKTDRPALLGLVRERDRPAAPDPDAGSVATLLGALLGATPGPDDTFVSLGGDSLSYVEASVALEERLGRLPADWHLQPIAWLEALPGKGDGARSLVARVETGVLLRAVAIVLIVGNHAGAFLIAGGAHLLFAVAGFNAARFQVSSGAWGRSIARIAVPSMLWIGGAVVLDDGFGVSHALLVHGLLDGTGRWIYWFIEALVQVLVVSALVMRVPAVRRFEQRRPFLLPALLLVPALAVRFDLIEVGAQHLIRFRPHEIAWIFLLGWLAARATTPRQRIFVSAVALAAVPGFLVTGARDAVLLAGLLLLVWVATVPVPRGAPRLVGPVASASMYIYLTHVQVHPLVSGRSPVLGILASLAVGIAAWRIAQPVQRGLEGAVARWRTTSSAAGSPGASPLPPRLRPGFLR